MALRCLLEPWFSVSRSHPLCAAREKLFQIAEPKPHPVPGAPEGDAHVRGLDSTLGAITPLDRHGPAMLAGGVPGPGVQRAHVHAEKYCRFLAREEPVTGKTLDLTNGTLAATFNSISGTGSATHGMKLDTVGGSLTITNGTTISTSTAQAIFVVNSTATVNFGNTTIGTAAAGSGSGAGAEGLRLENDPSGTYIFGTLTVQNTSVQGIQLFGGGANMTVSGAATVGPTGGDAILVQAHSGNVSFSSLSLDTITGRGIALNGHNGSFATTGGTIQAVTGNDVDISGGTGAVTIAENITNTAARSVSVINRPVLASNITLSGTLNDTGTGVFINNNTSGTIAFVGSSKVISTGASAAVTLTANTGATINFTGGGLDIDTTSGNGFSATGGGTISVTGANNTIDAVSATALNVVNTTIGAGNLNFLRISAGNNTAAADPVNGIFLDNTGNSGGLTITGTGAADSGGIIQRTTGSGIVASNTLGLSLNRMRIDTVGNGGASLHGIYAPNLRGTNSITNSTIIDWNSPTGNGIDVVNVNTNLTKLTVSGTTFNGTDTNNDGIFMEAQGTSSMELVVDGSTVFTEMFGDGVQVNGITGGTGNVRLTVKNSTFNNAAVLGNGGISMNPFGGMHLFANIDSNTFDTIMRPVTNLGAIGMTSGLTAETDVTIQNNTLNNLIGSRGITATIDGGNTRLLIDNNNIDRLGSTSKFAISVNSTNNAGAGTVGNVDVTIQNNDIGQQAALWTAGNGTAEAIFVTAQAGASMDALINANVVDANGSLEIIRARASGTGVLNATITNNDVTDTVGAHLEIVGAAGTISGQAGNLNLSFSGNIVPAGGVGTIGITEGSAGGPVSTVNVQQASAAAVAAANSGATVNVTGSPAFGAAAPTLPTLPTLPLIFAPTIDEPVTPPPSDDATPIVPPPDITTAIDGATPPVVQPPVIVDDGVLSQAELDSLVGAAIARWEAAGITAEQSALLHSARFSVADLPGWYLGESGGGNFTLDRDAAGNGWFVDSTPLADEEYANGTATANGGAAGRLDALTTVMHEMGHVLGLDDTYSDADAGSLMYGYLHLNERRVAAAHQADGAVPHAGGGLDFLFGSMSLGAATLQSDKVLTVVFDATVNAALSNGLAPSVSAQLRFTSTELGNVDSNTATTTLDSLTLGNLVFRDNNTNGVFDGGDAGLDGVALSLFVDANNDNVADGAALATTATAGGGLYSFAGLLPGTYLVRVDQSNFNAGGVLQSLPLAATNGGDPDNNVDNDSNGTLSPGNGAVSQSLTLAYNTEPTAGTGNDTNTTLDFGFTPILADLQVTKTNGGTTEVPGTNTVYTIVVSNAGPNTVVGATVADTFSAQFSSVTWTSIAAGGATGNSASSSGNISETVTLPSGSSITYTVTGVILSSATGNLANTATVTAPASVTDTNPGNNSATDTDTLTPQADLQITKTDGKTSSQPGVADTYTIIVSNAGPSDAPGVEIDDTFPAIFTSPMWTTAVSGGATVVVPTGSGNISTAGGAFLPSGGSITYTVTGTISAGATGTMSNTATVSAPGITDPTPGNNSATDTTTIVTDDLSITKTDSSASAVPGSNVTYTVTIANGSLSTQAANGATVSDVFDLSKLSNVNLLSFGTTNGATTDASLGTVAGGNFSATANLPINSTITYTFSATVLASATGSLANTATITAPAGFTESDTSNNSATDTDTLTPQADLAITKTDGVTTLVPGATATYTITVSNAGLSNVIGATVADTFPATLTGVTWTSAGAGGGTGTAAGSGNINDTVNLPAGGSVTYTVSGTVNPAATGTLANTATVTAPVGVTDPTPGNNSATDTDTLTPRADLVLTKFDVPDPARPGQNAFYTISLANAGPSDAQTVTITDLLPAGTTFVSASASAGWTPATPAVGGTGSVTFTKSTVAGAETGFFSIVVKLDANYSGATLSNTASVTSATTDPTPANDTATATSSIYRGIYVVAPGVSLPGRGTPPVLRVFDITTGVETQINAYEPSYKKSIRVATGDINGDGFDDIITSTITGNGRVRVFDGRTGDQFGGAFAELAVFPEAGARGAYVASGDVNDDGRDDIIVGSGLRASGGGKVRVFSGMDGSVLATNEPFGPAFRGGVRVAAGDVNGDGVADIIASTGFGGRDVRVTSGISTTVLHDLHIGGAQYKGGVFVAAADITGDGNADIIAGRDRGRTIIETFNGTTGAPIGTITPFAPGYSLGVRVAAADVNSDGIADIIAASGGRNQSKVKFFDGTTSTEITSRTFSAFPAFPTSSLFVAGTSPIPPASIVI